MKKELGENTEASEMQFCRNGIPLYAARRQKIVRGRCFRPGVRSLPTQF